MKFKFSKDLEYQRDAINAIVGIFDTGKNIIHAETPFALQSQSQVIGNELELDDDRLLKNLRSIQEQNKIESRAEKIASMDFSVEMETGTGKTYVYLRTVFELHQKYGLKKFIILVPSVAIREGVLKTIEQTKGHFREIYNAGCGYFSYDSGKLSRVRDFAQSNDIQVMIMTIQSFAGNERLVMRQTPDRFHGDRPIDLIAETKPVVIMDEPQNMESELSKAAIADLRPLFKLRYSATHKEIHNLTYRLSPIDAYKMNLVKKIQVYGVKYIDPNELLFKIKTLEVKGKKIFAEALLEKRLANGGYACAIASIKAGDDLYRKTGENEKYKNITVVDVNKQYDYIELSNGVKYKMEAGENKEEIFRAQLAETIRAHFWKQEQVGEKIKVLSLFFIDRVDNYVHGGMLAKIFEEEFEKRKSEFEHFKDIEAKSAHKGYFAGKKEKGEVVFKDTKGDSAIDKEAYDLIMKNKEKLLSFEEPVSFIFSHSALKEGWDNPNIFQICTLRETKSEMKKRQEIGRGLRLPLDTEGNRMYDPQTNILTVIANESYEEYVGTLQGEFEEAGYAGNAPSISNVRAKTRVKTTRYLTDPEFLELWKKIQQKTTFNIELDIEKIKEEAAGEINKLDLSTLAVTVDRVSVYFDAQEQVKTSFLGNAILAVPKKNVRIENIAGRIAKETGLTRGSICSLLQKINNLKLVFENPEEFTRSVSVIIRQKIEDSLSNESVKYVPTNDYWEVSLFKEFDSYLSRLFKSGKSPFTHVEFDSEGERQFAEHLEQTPNVKVYTKLPRGFYIDTPIGEYRPDWAIVWHADEGDTLYLVRETKFGHAGISKEEIFRNLRPDEQKKILWGESHFRAIGADFALATKADLSDLK
jgi:type III restriction enzyme